MLVFWANKGLGKRGRLTKSQLSRKKKCLKQPKLQINTISLLMVICLFQVPNVWGDGVKKTNFYRRFLGGLRNAVHNNAPPLPFRFLLMPLLLINKFRSRVRNGKCKVASTKSKSKYFQRGNSSPKLQLTNLYVKSTGTLRALTAPQRKKNPRHFETGFYYYIVR